jgi:polysaccharide biosynthesis protein PslH
MNILFLSHRLPFPPNKGEKIRAFHMLTHLAKAHVVHLGCFVDDPADMQYTTKMREWVRGENLFVPLSKSLAGARMMGALAIGAPLTTSYFASTRLRRWASDLLRAKKIDCAIAFSAAMAPFLLDQKGFDPSRIILDMVDVDSDKWNQYAGAVKGPKAWIYRREASTLFDFERKLAGRCGATILVSPHEVETFCRLAPETRPRVYSVANGVDLDYFRAGDAYSDPFGSDELPIVMTGTMDYRPNDEGAIWFVEKVLPLVLEQLPRARFYAVGANPTDRLKSIAGPNVAVTGRVDDVRPYLAYAKVAVAPLHLARGVQNKVLEGMAMQKPVVVTSPASRALDVNSGAEVWIADEPRSFAQAVIEAATGDQSTRIAERGRRYVEQHHDWERNFLTLDYLLGAARKPQSDPHEIHPPRAVESAAFY